MLKSKRNFKAIFNGKGNRVEFDKVASERNNDTIREDPDMKIIRKVYQVKCATTQQIKDLLHDETDSTEKKIEERISKLVKLRLITRYKLEYIENNEKSLTNNIYMLDINGKYLLEGEEVRKVEWDLKDNLAIKSKPEIFLKQLITNELIIKYLKQSKNFHSYEMKPRIKYYSDKVGSYIRPNALIDFGIEDGKKVHFVVYALRKDKYWKSQAKKDIDYIEKIYMDFRKTEKLTQPPIIMFICEDNEQIIDFCKLTEGTSLPLSYTIFTTDEMISNNKPQHSIAIVKKDQDKYYVEYPELVALA